MSQPNRRLLEAAGPIDVVHPEIDPARRARRPGTVTSNHDSPTGEAGASLPRHGASLGERAVGRTPPGQVAGPVPAGPGCQAGPGGKQVPWRHGMRSERAGTSAATPASPSSGLTWKRILEAGRRAPSARNWQPWDFVVRHGPHRADRAGPGVAGGAARGPSRPRPSPWSRPILDDEHRREGLRYDLGQATMDIMLAAADLGIGSGHASVGRPGPGPAAAGFPGGSLPAY